MRYSHCFVLDILVLTVRFSDVKVEPYSSEGAGMPLALSWRLSWPASAVNAHRRFSYRSCLSLPNITPHYVWPDLALWLDGITLDFDLLLIAHKTVGFASQLLLPGQFWLPTILRCLWMAEVNYFATVI